MRKGERMAKKRRTISKVDTDLEQLLANKKLTRVHVYGGKACKVEPRVWNHIYAKAEEEKQWAEKHEYADNPDSWPASGMSIKYLKVALQSSVEELALKSYRYFHHRAHAKSNVWGLDCPTDPEAKHEWEKLAGKKIRDDC